MDAFLPIKFKEAISKIYHKPGIFALSASITFSIPFKIGIVNISGTYSFKNEPGQLRRREFEGSKSAAHQGPILRPHIRPNQSPKKDR